MPNKFFYLSLKIEPRLYRVKIAMDGGTKPGGSTMDLVDLEAQIDERTRAILVNNPTNPHGVIFDKANLEGVLRIAEKYKAC
jgi:aspartate/methionine/tyrosine aminotransferase